MRIPHEPHGTITKGRWKGARAALVEDNGNELVIRPFSDTAPTEDAKMHLDPRTPITCEPDCFKLDNEEERWCPKWHTSETP